MAKHVYMDVILTSNFEGQPILVADELRKFFVNCIIDLVSIGSDYLITNLKMDFPLATIYKQIYV